MRATLYPSKERRYRRLKTGEQSWALSLWDYCRLVVFWLNFVLIGTSAYTQTNVWQGSAGENNWFSETWSLGSLPTNTQDAVVDNATTAQIPLNGGVDAEAASLTVTNAGSMVQLTGGDLNISNNGLVTIGLGGTLRFSGGFLAGVLMQNDGLIAFDASGDLSLGHVATGSGRLVMEGSGTLTIFTDNTYSGGTTISAGAIQLGDGGTTGSITGNILNNGVLIFNRSNTLLVPGAISGSGSVQQSGTGTSILLGNNTYTGGHSSMRERCSLVQVERVEVSLETLLTTEP